MNKHDKQLIRALLDAPEETRTFASAQDQSKYERIRSLLRAAQASENPAPPAGLTDSVMTRLAAGPVVARPSLQALSAQGLAYVFIAFALFYCIIGVGMHLALADAAFGELPGWIWRQPRIALLAALLFGLCGLLLLKNGRKVAKLLYLGLAGYMLCLTANALQAQLAANLTAPPLGLTFGLLGYVAGGLSICLFLGDMLRRLPQNGRHKTEG